MQDKITGLTGLIDRFCSYSTKHKLGALVFALIVAGGFALGIPRIRGEVLLEEMLPYTHPYLKIIDKYSKIFGSGGSSVAIAVKSIDGDIFKDSILNKVQAITNEVAKWDETYSTLTVSIASRSVKVVKTLGDGEIKVLSLMWPDPPKTPEGMDELKKNIFSDPIIRGVLASRDGTAVLIFTEFHEGISYGGIFKKLNELHSKYEDKETTLHMVGFPVLMGWIYSYKPEIVMVMGISVCIMILVLFFIFRNFIGMAVPVTFGIISTAMGLGFIGWTGVNFSPLLYVLAFLVGARIVSHSVQITHRYMEIYVSTRDKNKTCLQTMSSMLLPNWAGVITDAAGFLILIFVKIALMQQVAIFMTFWMMTVCLCGILTPILCTYLTTAGAAKNYVEKAAHITLMDRICTGLAGFSIGRGKIFVVAATVAAAVFCTIQVEQLKIGDSSPGSPLLWPDHPYNQAQGTVDTTFDASSEALILYYDGAKESVYDPAVLNTFEAFDRHMRSTLPDIYKSSDSFMGLMKSMNMIMHDGDMIWRELPKEENVVTGLIGWTRSQTDLYTLRRYFNDDMSKAQITLYFADHTSDNLLRIRDSAYGFFKNHSMKTQNGEFQLAGGRIGMEIAVNEEMLRTHAMIDTMVIIAIFVILVGFYRSIVGALMFTLPLLLANSVAYAYMAMNDIGLSINSLPVAAVGVGVGVDFSIYIYNRCIEEFRTNNNWKEIILISVRTSGKAVVFTGLTMVLPILTWLVLSDLKFQAQMGLFLAMILSVNVLLSLTLHPLMLLLIKPKFIVRLSQEQSAFL
jgi:uncharacterized protein